MIVSTFEWISPYFHNISATRTLSKLLGRYRHKGIVRFLQKANLDTKEIVHDQAGEATRLLEAGRTIPPQDSVPLRQLPHAEWLCGFAAWPLNTVQRQLEVDS
jgi:hypothetical protein